MSDTDDAFITLQVRRIDDLMASERRRFDDLRAADQIALVAALTSADKAVRAALDAAKEAVAKAEVAVSKQLLLLNELRSGVATEAQLTALAEKVDAVRRFMFVMTGMGVILSIAIPIIVSMLLRK